jgi:hypothetical protein
MLVSPDIEAAKGEPPVNDDAVADKVRTNAAASDLMRIPQAQE